MNRQWTEKIEVLCHSSIRITGEHTVYFDPYQITGGPHDAEYIFITHDHYDHFSAEDIAKVGNDNTVIIVPEAMAIQAKGLGLSSGHIITVSPGNQYQAGDISFETVAAYNVLKPFHPKTKGWVGYIVTMNNVRYYVAGDTDSTPEAGNVSCDVALVPIGGTYTMNAKKAADLVNHIRPKATVPTHYGVIVGKKEDADRFRANLEAGIQCDVFVKGATLRRVNKD